MEVKVAPIECDLEQVVQRGDAAVAAHLQTPPNRRVDLEEQDVELVNFDRSVWLDHSRSRSLVAARSQPPVFPGLHFAGSPGLNCFARLLRFGAFIVQFVQCGITLSLSLASRSFLCLVFDRALGTELTSAV